SPWTTGKNSTRDRRIKFLKKESGELFVPFLYVNCVGAQNNGKNIVTFDGGTTVYNADGEPVVLNGEHYEQDLVMVTEEKLLRPALVRTEKPKIAQKLEAIIKGIQHVKDMNGWAEQPKYVIGMSGGIDSAIVAAILTLAVGKDKVLGINMPTIYNSEKTKKAAEEVAEKLGIAYEVIPIGELVDVNCDLLNLSDLDGSGKKLSSLNEENVQAKIRGTSVLSNIAAKYGALFTNNGNKVEVFFGYATLYGDVNGAIAPLGDLTKAEIFELSRYLNKEVFHKEVIPETLIPDELFRFREDQIQPSAELKEKQVDPMKFGYHCAMIEKAMDYKKTSPEQFMRWYIDGTLHTNLNISYELMQRWGVDNPQEFVADLENFAQALQRSTFKRVQSPPIIITSKTSFGYDLRESILPWEPSLEYERLKQKIGEMERYQPRGEN
ncbi:MAG: NAD(+) synthase, partial [Nanoarchaeota archaeon]